MAAGDPMWQCAICQRFFYWNFCRQCPYCWTLPQTDVNYNVHFMPNHYLKKVNHPPTLNDVIDENLNRLGMPVVVPTKIISSEEWEVKSKTSARELLGLPRKTLIVNLFAGPGTGKSTTCAGIFFALKNLQVDCEIAHEYAKDLVWEKRTKTFENQIYLFAKQYHRIFTLLGQVDVVITDCPILLSPVYDTEARSTFEKLVVEEHNKMWNYNVFLKRKKKYNKVGRLHNEEQATEIDMKVLDVLDRNNQCYEVFDATPEGRDAIVKKIMMFLENKSVIWGKDNL
jgi:hypothetical protein